GLLAVALDAAYAQTAAAVPKKSWSLEGAREPEALGEKIASHLIVDGRDSVKAHVAPVALHVVLQSVPVPAEHLHAGVSTREACHRGEQLRHRRLDATGSAVMLQPRRSPGQ